MYHGAEASRLTQDWFASILSANQEIQGDLRRLRGASRMLVRDTATGARYVALLQDQIIGPVGITLQARCYSTRRQLHSELNEKLEAAWDAWGDPSTCTVEGVLSWVDVQLLVMRTLAVDGEVFLRLRPGVEGPFPFAVQLLDADLLNHELGSANPLQLPNGNDIRLGIECTPAGRRAAYHFWTAHPSEAGRRTTARIPAEEILHLFLPFRSGQLRGVPWFAPVLLNTKMLEAYQEAEITAARIASSKFPVITFNPENGGDIPEPEPGQDKIPLEVSPGDPWRLNPGESLLQFDPQHPTTAFGPFVRQVNQLISAGLSVGYASLTGDLTQVNYSSIRTGLLSERDTYRRLQHWLIRHLHWPVYRAWVKYAPLTGRIPARESGAYESVRWRPRGYQWVDPLKDIQASQIAIREGFTTRTAVCAEAGEDFEENLAQLAEEQKLADELGVKLPTAMPAPVPGDGAAPETDPAAAADESGRSLRIVHGGR